MWVRSLWWEDPLEKSTATHSSSLAWRIPMDRGAWWATVHRIAESGVGPCWNNLACMHAYFYERSPWRWPRVSRFGLGYRVLLHLSSLVPPSCQGILDGAHLSDHSTCFSQQPRLPWAGSLQGAWADLSASADLVPAVAGLLGGLRKLELAVFPSLIAFEYPGKCHPVGDKDRWASLRGRRT